MKKLCLIVALLLTAALLSSCSLEFLFQALVDNENNNAPLTNQKTEIYETGYETEAFDGGDYTAMYAYAPSASFGYYPDFNTEEYATIVENGFRLVSTDPLSTFSADVDTASYCNLRRMLNDGCAPAYIPSGSVRTEEMLNYFRYDCAAPADGSAFGITAQIADCPWNPANKLLMVCVRAADAPEATEEGSNLVFLVDVSGSMYGEDRIELVKKALELLVDNLGDKDTVSVVTYSDGEEILIEGANPVKDRPQLYSAIELLQAKGYTNGQRGLAQAYDIAQKYLRKGGNNRVIMCSDGDLNVGITSTSDLHDYVSEKKETGIYLSVLGFGSGNYKDTKMETLADDGNGNYYYIDSILEARKVLCEELTQTLFAVADDVKFQIEFNPAAVASYRQIGYENRALENQDFEDDKKDAGEVGAGACVTVLYEIVPAVDGESDSSLRYQTSTLTDAAESGEWLTLSVRYKQPGGSESILEAYPIGIEAVTDEPGNDFRFAAAVTEFSMILRNSEFIGNADYDSVIELLKGVELNDDYKEEFFSLVKIAERAAKLDQQ